MAFKLLGGGSDLPSIVSDINQNILQLKNDELTKIFKDDTGTPVVILDKNGLRTTTPGSGKDVTNASGSDYTFNSSQNVFKITDVGSTSITVPANVSQTTTIAHGKSYIPIVQGYLKGGVDYVPLATFTNATRDDVNGFVKFNTFVEIYTDATNINIRLINATGSTVGPYTIRYYLLQETAG